MPRNFYDKFGTCRSVPCSVFNFGFLCSLFVNLTVKEFLKLSTFAPVLSLSVVFCQYGRFSSSLQGSLASWKVLDFFLENSRTWKVLENHFGPGKSWKYILESHAFF